MGNMIYLHDLFTCREQGSLELETHTKMCTDVLAGCFGIFVASAETPHTHTHKAVIFSFGTALGTSLW